MASLQRIIASGQRAIERLPQVGARPMTVLQYLLELRRDWARTGTAGKTTSIVLPYGLVRPWRGICGEDDQGILISSTEALMILGMSTDAFLAFHVIVSLIGVASGLVVLYGLVTGQALGAWTAVFLATTILTSATGFALPPFGFDPPRAIGILSLVLLAVAVAAFYAFHLAAAWRWVYVVTAMIALYFNVFVAVIQAFGKLSFLQSLAPTQSEPPFVIAQLVVLAAFVALGFLAVRRFHPAMMKP